MKRSILSLGLLFLYCAMTFAQQTAERLNRAPVAVKATNGILVSWRSFVTDKDVSFDVYRNDTKIATAMTNRTNILDPDGIPGDKYRIVASSGEEESATAWGDIYTSIDVKRPAPVKNGDRMTFYLPNDMSVGDLDGDGEYELVLKWSPSDARDNGSGGMTSPTILDAYEMDGTQLWRINLGSNLRSGAHYCQFLVYDFDGDGKAEMICKTAPGTVDGTGRYVSEAGTDPAIKAINNNVSYVLPSGHIGGGEEMLTVFNGKTGAAMHTTWYCPNRAQKIGNADMGYGDWEKVHNRPTNYNRGERYNASVANLDGTAKLPSAIMQRGYYTFCYVWAVDWDGKQLKTRWLHQGLKDGWSVLDANGKVVAKGKGKSSFGQGVHSISVGDVNGDGFDEIVTGAATIAHDGRLLCSTGMGHGDAIHLTDLCPDRPGLEIMMPHEENNKFTEYGYDVHDATTGELLAHANGHFDNGRGLAADVIPENRGFEFWTIDGNDTYDCATGKSLLNERPDINFRIYWNGDPYDQTFDGRFSKENRGSRPRIKVYDSEKKTFVTFIEFRKHGNPSSINHTKSNPCLQADLLGDWREELIMVDTESMRNPDTCRLLVYSTPEETPYRVPCLMQDHVYRMGITWQNSSYNQPPHLGYYLPDYLGIDGKTYKMHTVSHAE